jgi:putative addiction module killer protein
MAVEMVLNDLSLLSPVSERGSARQLMTDLIGVLSTALTFGVKTLRTRDSLYDFMLAPGYPIAGWLNDNQVEREERSFLRTLATKTPLLAEITNSSVQEEESLADFKHQNEPAYALGIAYLLNALAVSFHSDPRWNYDNLDLEITRLEDRTNEENATAELILTTTTAKLIHASRREHIVGHKSQIEYRLRAEPWYPQDKLLPCYIADDGKNLMSEWIDSLCDLRAKEFIQSRLNQVKQGTLGDCKSVGEGVWELRISYGPAYRIYFSHVTTTQVLLLYGGDKSTQGQDIIKAKQYWKDYKKWQRITD